MEPNRGLYPRWCAGTFFVVDYDNARQLRSADTLSGGETFRLARGLYSMFYVLKAVEFKAVE